MSDSWKKLGGVIGEYAPKLGNVVGAFVPGAGLAGDIVGGLFNIFGTEDPDELVQIIQKDPQSALKLKELEANKEVELNRIIANREIALEKENTLRSIEVNETMREEVKSDGWFKGGWRPLFGYLLAIDFTIFVNFILYLAYLVVSGENPDAINMIPTLVSAFTVLFGAGFAVVGVTAVSRGDEKLARMGVVKPGVIATIGKILKRD